MAIGWEKLGRLLHADRTVWWMHDHTGASFAVPTGDGTVVDLYVTGRDATNRSMIGRCRVDLATRDLIEIEDDPVLQPGQLGAFDENGVSYPCVVEGDDQLLCYYTGWMPTVLTPFQNHIGLARRHEDGRLARVSRAPILARSDADFLSMGSCFVLREEPSVWRMWYTAFTAWGETAADAKHRYVIKYATSVDGINWERDDIVCISPVHPDEHSISRPSVLRIDGLYHMWFCWRGDHYRLGHAVSEDGIHWTRRDAELSIRPSESGWDSLDQCYPHVVRIDDVLYLLYCGNDYGRDGLGVARADVG